jgi:hypothetical protein
VRIWQGGKGVTGFHIKGNQRIIIMMVGDCGLDHCTAHPKLYVSNIVIGTESVNRWLIP